MRRFPWDGGLPTVAALVAALQFGLLPLLLSPGWVDGSLLVLLAALTEPLHYGLMHETIHGNLVSNEIWNRRTGRALGIALGLPWETMRFGHLAHHAFNRHEFDRPEAFAPGRSRFGVACVYYFKLVIGNALVYAIVPLLLLLPVSTTQRVLEYALRNPDAAPLRKAAIRAFTGRPVRDASRFDIVAILALDALALWLWGRWWPVFAACVMARWCVLSLLDNAPHYGMPLDSRLEARNTRLPRWAGWLVLNQNLHGAHHRNPGLRWTELPAAFAGSADTYDGSWIGALLRQFRGPVRLERKAADPVFTLRRNR